MSTCFTSISDAAWLILLSYADTQVVATMVITGDYFYRLIKQSDYLAEQTLLSAIKNDAHDTKNILKYCIANDIDLREPKGIVNACLLSKTICIFTEKCFKRMTLFSRTDLFQYYSRLLSFNWIESLRGTEYPLINIHNLMIKFEPRRLNKYETQFLKCFGAPVVSTESTRNCIYNITEFIDNLKTYTNYDEWKDIIFKSNIANDREFILSGSTVLKCVWKQYHSDLQDLDFFACNMSQGEFWRNVEDFISEMRVKGYPVVDTEHWRNARYNCITVDVEVNFHPEETDAFVFVPKRSGAWRWSHTLHHSHPLSRKLCHLLENKISTTDEYFMINQLYADIQKIEALNAMIREKIAGVYNWKCWLEEREKENHNWFHFQFIWRGDRFTKSSVLHVHDLDCCQVGFNGREVFGTYAFVQSINTETMISYKLVRNVYPESGSVQYEAFRCKERIIKYMDRGFTLVVDNSFGLDDDNKFNNIQEFDYTLRARSFITILLFDYSLNVNNSFNRSEQIGRLQQFDCSFGVKMMTYGRWLKQRVKAIKHSQAKNSLWAMVKCFYFNNDSFGLRKQFIEFLMNKL